MIISSKMGFTHLATRTHRSQLRKVRRSSAWASYVLMTNTRLNEKRWWLTTSKKRTYGRSRSRREPSLFTCQKSQTASPWFLVAMAAVVMCVPPTESGQLSPVTPGGDALWDSAPIPGDIGGRGRKFASPICPIGSQASRSPPERLRLCGLSSSVRPGCSRQRACPKATAAPTKRDDASGASSCPPGIDVIFSQK